MANLTKINNEATVPGDVVELLNHEAERINNKSFIAEDPVQFPRRFTSLPDIEIAAMLTATISWGNRKMICRDADRLLSLMDNSPYLYMMEEEYENLPDDMNIHRTFFTRHLKYYLRGLRSIYRHFASLDEFALHCKAPDSEYPAWAFTKGLQENFAGANNNELMSQCIPTKIDSSPLKRINMALRWLVRNDGIVDMGVWRSIKPSQLFIPLDVHVNNTSRQLNLISRKSTDRKTLDQLMQKLRPLNPYDPAIYDFALFGIGIMAKQNNGKNLSV